MALENVLIIGAFDFLGFHLSKHLLEEGINVYSMDLKVRSTPDHWREEKLMEIGRNSNLHIMEDYFLERDVSKKLDTIYFCLTERDIDLENVKSKLNRAIEWCQSNSTKLIFSSSLEVVNGRDKLITEEAATIPVTKAGEVYLELEELIQNKNTISAYSHMILRLPTVYGPWQPDHFAYQKALLAVEEGKHIEWVEDEYIEDVLFIDDVVSAFIKAGVCSSENDPIIHITSGKEGEWEKGMNIILDKECDPSRKIKGKLLNKKAVELLSFQTKTTIEEGISVQRNHIKLLLGKM